MRTLFFKIKNEIKNKSKFRQNFLLVARYQIISQLINLCMAPILSRLFTSEAFGVAALFSSLLAFISAFSTWKCEWLVPNTSSRTQASALMLGGVLSLFITLFCLSVLILIEPAWLFSWNGLELLYPYLNLMILAVLGTGLYQIMNAWYIRENELKPIAQTYLAQNLSNTALSIFTGLLGVIHSGLIISAVISSWVGVVSLFRKAVRLKKALLRLTWLRIWVTWKKYLKETSLSSLTALLNLTSLTVIPILLAHYFSAAEVGWYALMQRLALAPVRMVTQSMSQSFWSESAKLIKKNGKELKRLYLKSSFVLFLASIPVCILSLSGPLYIGHLFGKSEWQQAGFVLMALTPFLLGQIIVSPLSHLTVHGKQHWQFIWDVFRTIFIVLSIVFCHTMDYDFFTTILLMSLIVFVMYLVLFSLNLICVNNRAKL